MPKSRNVPILYAMAFLQGMVFYGPIATLYRQAAGVGLGQIALIEGISLALSVALELPWGLLAERMGYRRTMIFCSGLYFISKLVFWRASGFWGFLLERVLLGVIIAGLSGVDVGLLYRSCREEEAHRVFGIYNNMTTLGLLAATGVYTALIGEHYRLAGLLTAVSYGAAALLSLGLEEVRTPDGRRAREVLADFRETMKEILAQGEILGLLAGAALLGSVHQMVTVFFNQPQYQRSGMTVSQMGLAYAAVTLCGLLGGFSSRLGRRIGERGLLCLSSAVPALACLLLALAGGPILSVLCVIAVRVCFNLFQPLQATLQNRSIRGEDRATALSVHAVLIDAVTISGTLLFGYVGEGSLPAAFFLGSGLCLAALVLTWMRKGNE